MACLWHTSKHHFIHYLIDIILQARAHENIFSISQVKQYQCIHKYYLAQWALGINSNFVARCSQEHPFKYDINSIFSQHRFCCQLISACCLLTTQLSLNTNETHLPLPAQSHNLPTLQAIVNSSVPTFCLQCSDGDDCTEKHNHFACISFWLWLGSRADQDFQFSI